MPNHVTNLVQFACSRDRFMEIAEAVRQDGEFLGSVDFGKLIPMPESLNIECGSRGQRGLKEYREYLKAVDREINPWATRMEIPSLREFAEKTGTDYETIIMGKQYFDNMVNYGAPTWYEWSIENWGSKWNAYDCVEVEPESRYLQFTTAWSCVEPVIAELSKRFPEVPISYGWADESIGRNVGSIVLFGGKIIDEYLPPEDSKEAFELSAEIMDDDLHEMGFKFNEVTNTYDYVGLPPLDLSSSERLGEER